jgi:hypothetical protein
MDTIREWFGLGFAMLRWIMLASLRASFLYCIDLSYIDQSLQMKPKPPEP